MTIRDEMIGAKILRPGPGRYVPREQEISTLTLPPDAVVFRTDDTGRQAAARELAGGKSRGQRDLSRSTHELAALQRWR